MKTKISNYKRDFGTIRTAADEALNAARASEARESFNAEMRDLMDRLALLSTVVDSDLPALQALQAFDLDLDEANSDTAAAKDSATVTSDSRDLSHVVQPPVNSNCVKGLTTLDEF